MNNYKNLSCLRCGYPASQERTFTGCPVCEAQGVCVNFTTVYPVQEEKDRLRAAFLKPEGRGLWKRREFLPVDLSIAPVSLGEGDTPLLRCRRLGDLLGIPELYLKNETVNPTWSYKDRLCSVAVSKALEEKAPVITVSSTGNHGAAAAAYAAAAQIPCVIFTVQSVPATMKTLMQSYGAKLIVLENSLDRWKIMRQCIEKHNWYPVSGFVDPPVGSNSFGIDGYKTIAYELWEQLGDLPDVIAVPSAYSDGMYGIYKGVQELNALELTTRRTQMVASEVWGSLSAALDGNLEGPPRVDSHPTISFSIGGGRNTYQGLYTLRASNGTAVRCGDEEVRTMQQLLACTEGIYAEAASVTALVALQKLAAQGRLQADQRAVAIISSSGLKDPGMTAETLPQPPLIKPTEESLAAALEHTYGFQL